MPERVSITREPDDDLAVVCVSLGQAPGGAGFYIVFRGDPDATVALLAKALDVARDALPTYRYVDRRPGRPLG